MKKKQAKYKPSKSVNSNRKFSKTEISGMKGRLLSRLGQLKGNVSKLGDQTIGKNPQESSGNISSTPIHMADLGSDVFEHELTLGIVENEADELQEIEDALERIKKGSFGLCETCRKPIPKDRLKAIPYTRLCITCKKKEEGLS